MSTVRSPRPDIEAEIRFLTTDEGGRRGPCSSGYFPNHDFGIEGTYNDARHIYPENTEVWPGETAKAQLMFVAPELQVGRLYEGFEFTVQEGMRIVGYGCVTKVLNKDLKL